MIEIGGQSVQPAALYQSGSVSSLGKIILEQMSQSEQTYSYLSMEALKYEVRLRESIVAAAKDMNRSWATFATFEKSKGNSKYWDVDDKGVFKLKPGVRPSEAIRDIFKTGRKYAFECATAIVILYYKAVLDTMDESAFNQAFPNLRLYSWNYDPDLGLQTHVVADLLPGDVVYFKNPDVDPKNPEWQGENAVVMGDGTYFGHGVGIKSKEKMIAVLNRKRKPDATQSAYLMDEVTRPDFRNLHQLASGSRKPAEGTRRHKPVLVFREAYFEESIPYTVFIAQWETLEQNALIIKMGNIHYKMI